jgi:CRP-like cAMP-binding protein
MAVKEIVREIDFFKDFTDEDFEILINQGEIKKVPAGTVLIEEGDKSRDLYFLVNGRIEITMKAGMHDIEDVHIYRLKPGETVGEFAFIDGFPRSASALVDIESLILKFDYAKLQVLFDKNPRLGFIFMKKISKLLTERIRSANISNRNLLIW